MKIQKNYEMVKNILTLKSNKKINSQYGRFLRMSKKELNSLIKINLVIENSFKFPTNNGYSKYSNFTFNCSKKTLYYDRNLFKFLRLRANFKNLETKNPELKFNWQYYKTIKYRIMNLHSLATILSDVIFFSLIQQGIVSLHCASINLDGVSYAIFGPPSTGKTLTTILACKEKGASFISEDISLFDGSFLYGVPWTNKLKSYIFLNMSSIKRKFPVFHYLKSQHKNIKTHLNKFQEKTTVDKIVILEKSSEEKIEEISPIIAKEKIINLNNYLFKYRNSPVLSAYDYFNNPGLLRDSIDKEKFLIQNLINNVNKFYLLKTSNSLDFLKLFEKI